MFHRLRDCSFSRILSILSFFASRLNELFFHPKGVGKCLHMVSVYQLLCVQLVHMCIEMVCSVKTKNFFSLLSPPLTFSLYLSPPLFPSLMLFPFFFPSLFLLQTLLLAFLFFFSFFF
jgi:hypothetical protein